MNKAPIKRFNSNLGSPFTSTFEISRIICHIYDYEKYFWKKKIIEKYGMEAFKRFFLEIIFSNELLPQKMTNLRFEEFSSIQNKYSTRLLNISWEASKNSYEHWKCEKRASQSLASSAFSFTWRHKGIANQKSESTNVLFIWFWLALIN